MLELQRFLRAGGVHPVGDEPVGVALGVARPTRGQRTRDAQRRGERRPDFALAQSGVTRRRRSAGSLARRRPSSPPRMPQATSRTSTLCIRPSVGSALSKNRASVLNGIADRSVLEHAAESQHHPLQARRPHDLLGLGLGRAVHVAGPHRVVGAKQSRWCGADCGRRTRRCSTPGRSAAESVGPQRRAPPSPLPRR